jgi:predicted nucleotide-binding protein
MTPEPFRLFFREYDGKRIPSPVVLRKWLEENADVPAAHADHAAELLIRNARDVGLLRTIKGSDYVMLDGQVEAPGLADGSEDEAAIAEESDEVPVDLADTPAATPAARIGKVFIGHGKNRKPVEQLKSMLGTLGVQVGVAIDESHQGRPVSQKVADVMRECTSACFIFTADENYKSDDGVEHWRPSDNAVYELGAASVLYGRRIVIFKESGVDFASDFSDLGYISFDKDRLDAKMGDLLKELVSFGILEIRAASAV